MKNIFKKIIGTAAVLCMVFSFAACGKRTSSKISKDGIITLQYWSIYPQGDENTAWMLAKIAQFQDNNPNIIIEHTGISFWDYFTKINTSQTDPNGPDVFIHTITDNAARAAGGISLDISPYFKPGELTADDFGVMDRDAVTYKGGIYGVPFITDGRVLYYNKDIVNELKNTTDAQWQGTKIGKKQGTTIKGKPADLLDNNGDVRAPGTYDELGAYSELLTVRASDRKITRLGFDLSIGNNTIVNLIWTYGGSCFDAAQKPVVNSDPGVKKAFEVWYELARIHNIQDVNAFIGSTAGTADTVNLFFQKSVGLMIATNEIPWQNDKMSAGNKVNLGAAPIPYSGNNRYNFSGGFSIEISNRLKKDDPRVAQAAYDFVKFLMSDEVQRELLVENGSMPGKLSIYKELVAGYDDPVKKVVIEEMNYRRPFDFVPDAPQWWGPVFDSLTKYVSGIYDLDKALSEAQKGIEKIQRTN
jgi:multiple sugar transport system substrate-binding protein